MTDHNLRIRLVHRSRGRKSLLLGQISGVTTADGTPRNRHIRPPWTRARSAVSQRTQRQNEIEEFVSARWRKCLLVYTKSARKMSRLCKLSVTSLSTTTRRWLHQDDRPSPRRREARASPPRLVIRKIRVPHPRPAFGLGWESFARAMAP